MNNSWNIGRVKILLGLFTSEVIQAPYEGYKVLSEAHLKNRKLISRNMGILGYLMLLHKLYINVAILHNLSLKVLLNYLSWTD